jgi:hypothetical protein
MEQLQGEATPTKPCPAVTANHKSIDPSGVGPGRRRQMGRR